MATPQGADNLFNSFGMPSGDNSFVVKKISAKELKSKYACGGTAKEGYIFLQGDHRETIKDTLVNLGFAEDTIELH